MKKHTIVGIALVMGNAFSWNDISFGCKFVLQRWQMYRQASR